HGLKVGIDAVHLLSNRMFPPPASLRIQICGVKERKRTNSIYVSINSVQKYGNSPCSYSSDNSVCAHFFRAGGLLHLQLSRRDGRVHISHRRARRRRRER